MTALLLDTSVAIPLRDGDVSIVARAATLTTAPYLSILTVAELEGGVFARPALAAARRRGLDALLGRLDVLPFDDAELSAYRAILMASGFSRGRILDRLIAAAALARGLRLATRNAKDFTDLPGLIVEEW